MRIARIELENWMCFRGRHVLDLPASAIAVVAAYKEDGRRSNWGGKTAFLEAIDWCLYGVHRKRLDDAVITRGEDRCEVFVVFDDGLEVRRRRNRGKGKDAYEFVVSFGDETWEKKAAEEEIERRIGLTWEEQRATVRFQQGDTEALAGDESGKRQKTLRRWFRLDAFDRMCTRARKLARDASAEARVLDERIRAETERLPEEISPELIEASVRAFSELEAKLEDARKRAEEATLDQERLRRLVRWEALVERGTRLRGEVKELGAIIAASDAAEDEVAIAAAAHLAAKEELEAFGDVMDGSWDRECPITHEECPAANQILADRDQAEHRQVELRVAESSACQAWLGARSRSEKARQQRRAVERVAADLKALRDEAKALKPDVDAWRASASEGETLLGANARSIARSQEARDEADAMRGDVEELRKTVAERRRVADAREAALTRLEEMERERAAALKRSASCRVAARALGPGGVPREIAAARVALLEERANALLEGTGLSVEISWQRPTQKLEPECGECGRAYKGQRDKKCPDCGAERAPKMSDDLEILVDDGSGEIEDVRAKSGGARVLIGVAFRLAGGAMLRELRRSPVAWASIDEALGALDVANRDRLVGTLTRMLGAVGLEQALLVSHDVGVLDSLPAKIQIIRSESAGESRVSMA
jgi:DNA repair exonuclease SbcCD ATPase subunit